MKSFTIKESTTKKSASVLISWTGGHKDSFLTKEVTVEGVKTHFARLYPGLTVLAVNEMQGKFEILASDSTAICGFIDK